MKSLALKRWTLLGASALAGMLLFQAAPAQAQSVYERVAHSAHAVASNVAYNDDDDDDDRRDRRGEGRRGHDRDWGRDHDRHRGRDRGYDRDDDRRHHGRYEHRDHRSHHHWEQQRRAEAYREAERRRWEDQQRYQHSRHYSPPRYSNHGRHTGHSFGRDYRFTRWQDVSPAWVNQYYGVRPGWSHRSGRWHADQSIYYRASANCHRPRIFVSQRYQPWNGYVDYHTPHVAWYHDRPDWVYVNGRQRPYYYDHHRSAYYTRDDNNAEILIGVAVAAVGLALVLGGL